MLELTKLKIFFIALSVISISSILFINRDRLFAQNNCSSSTLCATSGSIGGGLLAVGASASGTVTVTGAGIGSICFAQPSDGSDMIALGAIPSCTVTAPNTVVVRVLAIITLTPAAKTYNIRVIQ
jgi:hypothetical protein